MPANLSPEFLKARARFREATTPAEKLAALEEMLATIPKHKGTDKMQADIKRRIAKFRAGEEHAQRGRGRSDLHVDHEGAGQVVLLGVPNCGKSSLLAAMTNAHPEIADYPFSTLRPIPGMMHFEDVPIQLIDLPPMTPEFTESWVYNIVRESDLALILMDGAADETPETQLAQILDLVGARHVLLSPSRHESEDERIKIVPYLLLATKADRPEHERVLNAVNGDSPPLAVSAQSSQGLDELARRVFDALEIVRVYTKLPGKPADMDEPYTLPAGSTILDAVRTVHREFEDRLKYVRIWGSGRFDGQQVPSDHVLADRDVIEIHVR
ncbi:MAG: 50S ribosome-binding GTPase [Candidatus Bipolaricaulota bacterium]|nr:MAG: 50S ribosome-binding GTPase [Candidatus Bipolaricaulota bacterium]